MKKLGSRVKLFSKEKWNQNAKKIVYRTVTAKFTQNLILHGILENTGDALIAESSTDTFWGTGLHLHDRLALDKNAWKNKGGVMSEILNRV